MAAFEEEMETADERTSVLFEHCSALMRTWLDVEERVLSGREATQSFSSTATLCVSCCTGVLAGVSVLPGFDHLLW